ncbi:hypothetical protein BGZ81_001385, partial [Podila clonocystis]
MPLCATLGDVRATLVMLGTSLSLKGADHVYSAVGKRTNFHRIMKFPLFDDQDVEDVLSELVDISDCTLPHVKRRKQRLNYEKKKCETFWTATGPAMWCIYSALVLASNLQGGKIWFASKAQVDFIDKDLCSQRVHSDSVHWLMDEPLVVEVEEEELKRSNVDPGFSQHFENEISSDTRCSCKQMEPENPSLKRIRDDFIASGVPNESKILRIDLKTPGIQ